MSGNKLTLSQILSGVFCIMVLLVALQVPQVQGQITFSKDWRAGGKRANTLSANGVSVLDVPCDQLASWSNTQIRDLVRKEAVALLQCEFNVNPNKNEVTNRKK